MALLVIWLNQHKDLRAIIVSEQSYAEKSITVSQQAALVLHIF